MLTQYERATIRETLAYFEGPISELDEKLFEEAKASILQKFDRLDEWEEELYAEIERRADERERDTSWGQDQ